MDKKQQIVTYGVPASGIPRHLSALFDRVYKDENAMTIEKDGKIVSALQIVPYTMTYLGTRSRWLYLRVCTAPEEGVGLMRQLLQETFEEMERREVAISALIPADPWLFDYYREQGYTEAFDYSVETYIRPNTPVQLPKITVIQPEVPTTDELFAYFNRKLRERPSCILHSQDDFITILRDLQLDNGGMYTALDENEKVVGMAFALPLEAGTAPSDKKLLSRNFFTTRKRSRNYYCKSLPCKITYRKRRSIPSHPSGYLTYGYGPHHRHETHDPPLAIQTTRKPRLQKRLGTKWITKR